MIVRIRPSPDQLRWHAKSALNAFDTLELADAAEHAKEELRSLLRYIDALDRADDAVLVSRIEAIEPGVRIEVAVCDSQASNFADLKDSRLVSV